MGSKTIIFIHGMFFTPLCWENWIGFFQAKGYQCLAPAWPGRDHTVEELRKKHPDAELGKLSLADVAAFYAGEVSKLAEKPIVIGHSMGGLVAQILLQKELVEVGVAVNSAPPLGVITTQWSFIKSSWPLITPFAPKGTPYFMPFEHFQYAFVHTLPPEEQRAAYDQYVVPESRRVGLGLFSAAARVDFVKPRPPLLMIAGSEDHIIPAGLNHRNYVKYKASPSVTHYRVFNRRTHFILGQPEWEEVADYIATWLTKNTAQ